MIYLKFKKYLLLLLIILFSCSESEGEDSIPVLRSNVLIDKGIFKVSYNEIFEQPNWIEYTVSNRPKNVDRGNKDFYLESGVFTSDNADYYKNEWDKGHLAPAATFSDSEDNLNKTFSFINCAMQIDNLNRGEWAQLEQQVRDWSVNGNVNVKIELVFAANHIIRTTGVHVPTGFWKNLTFSNGNQTCYYFPNSSTNKNWDQYENTCN
ncbi:MAG: DNA/RNA non-specific endonuclease [Flavobacteriaceae bacterium]|nr:DNA/RNA non-specific endonuclease [Flavobacteriaceae bacterium]MBT4958776.1 DNA/RNA non-specific endonuclease [Flavobacteriaceae bacterium]MBT6170006.1 DNA/RNA non-specific endonuclease [Flavobacteriaceae bacterium]MDG1831402.1 DNA/RNA non-specific endonuclease [Flavobacteriaceae bacterium]